jgi:hypothetical protein
LCVDILKNIDSFTILECVPRALILPPVNIYPTGIGGNKNFNNSFELELHLAPLTDSVGVGHQIVPDDQYVNNGYIDQIANAGVGKDARNDRHQCENVRIDAVTMVFDHFTVDTDQHFDGVFVVGQGVGGVAFLADVVGG